MNWRIYTFAARKFYQDYGFLHASALTFYTLFAVVPILATAFGVAKGFGLETFLNTQLDKAFPGQETVVQFLSEYAQKLLAQSSGGLIAGVALLVLFYSVYSMLNHIEQSLNKIWQVPDTRDLYLRITHYLSLILVAPIILIAAGSLKLLIAKKIHDYNLVLSWSSSVTSVILVVIFFTWLYQYMPNARVKLKAALFGSIHTGIAYTLIQSFLVESQLLMNDYGAVYGSLAALPIFLLWVQISWVTVLYGAQLCFVWQNKIQADWELDINKLSITTQQDLLTKIANSCVMQFKLNLPPLTEKQIARSLQIPTCTVRQLLAKLIDADVLIETTSNGYQPAKNIDLLDSNAILEAINNQGIKLVGIR